MSEFEIRQEIPCRHCQGRGTRINPEWIGNELRKAREAAGLSRETLAQALGVSRVYLWQLERGERNPAKWLQRYQQALANPKAHTASPDPNPA